MPKPDGSLRFQHLYLENWRNFTLAEVDFHRRVILAGPNGAGKSNLLDTLRFLHDLSVGGLQRSIGSRRGFSRLRCLAARQHSAITIAVRIGPDDGGSGWEYELQFGQENLRRPEILRERVAKDGTVILCRPDERDANDPERLTETALEHACSNGEFRELAEFFASIRYVNAVPQLIREPERSVGRAEDPFGGSLLEQIAATPENVQYARLRWIREALQTAAAPGIEALELRADKRGVPHLRARYGTAWQTEEQFSDGTLRLVAMLWTALDGSGPMLAEEPEQGLHPEAVRQLLPMLRGIQRRTDRQILLTTHSKELLADDRIKPEEVLLLVPVEEGTAVRAATHPEDAAALLDGCYRSAAAEIDENQLALFDEF